MTQGYILMADIINSRTKDSAELMEGLKALVTTINKKYKKNILSPLTITLGDEFQSIINDLKSCVEIIIKIEEEIVLQHLDFSLRYVVQYGAVDTKINNKVAYEMLGSGLTMARENLELAKKAKDGRVHFHVMNEADAKLLENLFFVFIFIKDSWSRSDYYVVAEFIKGLNYREAAEQLDKDSSQLWKREKSLMIKEYMATKRSIIDIVNRLG